MGQRRFIAGAVCPDCGEEDKLFVLADDVETVRCSRCSFTAARDQKIESGAVSEWSPIKLEPGPE